MKSRSDSSIYFQNFETGESTFEEPTCVPEPTTTAEWREAQDRLFGHLAPLPYPWIRVKSKTRGSIYFFNTDTGVSTIREPSDTIDLTSAMATEKFCAVAY